MNFLEKQKKFDQNESELSFFFIYAYVLFIVCIKMLLFVGKKFYQI